MADMVKIAARDSYGNTLVELAKASAAIILIYTVRDLDLVAYWLANGLIVCSEVYLTALLVKLLRKKK